MQFSLDSFRHFKGISRHKLVFLNKKVCIIIKPLDHEIVFAPNINCRWKIFAQDLASTVRQNMNSWTGNVSAESRVEGDSTTCCFEKHMTGGMGRKGERRCQCGADKEPHCQSISTSVQSWNNRKLGEGRKGKSDSAALALPAEGWLFKGFFEMNQQPPALMVASSTRLPALM